MDVGKPFLGIYYLKERIKRQVRGVSSLDIDFTDLHPATDR
jgi:hypothetical protein